MLQKTLFFALTITLCKTLIAQPTDDQYVSKYSDNKTPYPLFAGKFGPRDPAYNNTEAKILGENFDAFYGNPKFNASFSDKIRAFNPRFQIIDYYGRWQTSNDTRKELERNKEKALHYVVGTLLTPMDETTTEIEITDMLHGGLVASTVSNDEYISYFSQGEFKFVTWLRIDNELVKIIAVEDNKITLERGIDGTTPTAHAIDDFVLSPVYATPPEPGMNEEVSYRLDERTDIRWKRINAHLRNQYRTKRAGVWIDILHGNLSQYSMAGVRIYDRLYDPDEKQILTGLRRSDYIQAGIKDIQDRFLAEYGFYPVIWGNNMLYPFSLENDRVQLLLQTDIKPRPIDGFAQENGIADYGTHDPTVSGKVFQYAPADMWFRNLQSLAFFSQNKLAVQFLMMDGGQDNALFAALPPERKASLFAFGYASYLLAVHVHDDDNIYTRFGFTPVINPKNGQKDYIALDPMFTWDIGRPTENYPADTFDAMRVGDTSVFIRSFENGIVAVNSADEDTFAIDFSEYGNFIDPKNNYAPVGIVELAPKTGVLYLYEDKRPKSPEDIADLNVQATCDQSPLLTWSDTNGETGYRIRRRIVGEPTFTNLFDTSDNATEYTDVDAQAGITYEYMVRPIINGVAVKISNTVIIETPQCNITDVEGLVTTPVCGEGISLSWTDVNGEEGYRVRRKLQSAATFTNLADVGTNKTEYLDQSAEENVPYTYMVRPLSGGKAVAISNTPSITLTCDER